MSIDPAMEASLEIPAAPTASSEANTARSGLNAIHGEF